MLDLIPVVNLEDTSLYVYKQIRDKNLKDNSFIADSPKVVNLLLESDIQIHSILATQEYYDMHNILIENQNIPKLFVATKKLLEQIVGHKIHHNCMMHGVRPEHTALEDLGDTIIMLDEISSTENIGSIARSAAALGVDAYVLPKQGPHPYGRRSLRVSMGHISLLKTYLYDDIKTSIKSFQTLGYKVFAAEVSSDAIELSDLKIPKKWVLLMGHEGKGLALDVIDLCDACVSIEMVAGIKSFNVAVAASIMLYELRHKDLKALK